MSGNTKKFVTKNGLQTQNIDFVSNNESNTVTFSVSDEGILSVEGDIRLSNSLYDANNSTGTPGQILSTTEDGIQWVNVGDVQGSSGFSGYSGISGFSGFSGISGEIGESGFSGISGFSGDSGISGYSGFSGINAPAIVFDGGSPFNDYTAGPVFDAGGIH
jgi:collagen type IV alpha